MTNLTEQYRELEQDFFAYQKMLNEANKDLNKYYLENTKLKTENKWYSEQLNEAVKEEGHLKGLLKECKPFIELCNYTPENKRLLEQIVEQIGDK